MKICELTPENIGAACSIFRVEKLRITQSEFAVKHHISKAALSYYERGISLSLLTFLAYTKEGFIEYLDNINISDVAALLKTNAFKQRAFINRDLAKPI